MRPGAMRVLRALDELVLDHHRPVTALELRDHLEVDSDTVVDHLSLLMGALYVEEAAYAGSRPPMDPTTAAPLRVTAAGRARLVFGSTPA